MDKGTKDFLKIVVGRVGLRDSQKTQRAIEWVTHTFRHVGSSFGGADFGTAFATTAIVEAFVIDKAGFLSKEVWALTKCVR